MVGDRESSDALLRRVLEIVPDHREAFARLERRFDAAKDKGIFAIGVDSDQAKLVPDAPILTSVVKRVDNAVYQTIIDANEGNFPGGEVVDLGLKEEGMILAPFGRFDGDVPQQVENEVDEAEKGIISGEIKVPDTPQQ